MRVLMVMQHVNFFRNLDTVVRELDARGHETVLLHGTPDDTRTKKRIAAKKTKMVFLGRGIAAIRSEVASVTVGYRPEPTEPLAHRLRLGRMIVNRAIYLRKGHPAPNRVMEGITKELPPRVRRLIELPPVRMLLRRRLTLRLWRLVERRARPSATVLEVLREIDPDVVLVSPTVWPKRPVEADYLRAARALGVPTVGYLNSWDNLTSKGTVHLLPDTYIVWNEALAEEAVTLHDIPRSVIAVTGAPHVDRFFVASPSATHDEIRLEMGCPTDRPYLVYLCSSRTLITDERELVSRIADAVARRLDAPPTIVVRPHPTNPMPWEKYEHAGVVVYPKQGDQADTPKAWQAYFDQLSGALCTFGLNTTAFLEAVAADKPCLTIVADEFFAVQGRTGHFRHLLAGDFLEVSRDADELADRVARIMDGADEKAEGRRGFARSFLRPVALDRPVAPIVADVLEATAARGREALDARRPAVEAVHAAPVGGAH